ncbi:hypothetical protein [Maribacter cobaltidurans]|uniref:Uncharacterized protein n=1 Tax=Maribacter cobaltidurans TaxID=1178778 RepID=A0A223V5H9_9FLAO|nr:hypothetical protein [Maribacter cobaltidurans]ASV30675.1 hypothetical protein CJ263_10865 [Maribacter cobaltidurans]GGD80811.1 hypothetical protein GCM10011412_18190 [Maribacter cobaltidurans]
MTITDFTYFLENPNKVVDPLQTKQLEDIIEEYPYFQAARALHLKGLKNLNSYKYNKALKTTAAYTTDRDVLFDFITSKDFLRYDLTGSTGNVDYLDTAEPVDKTEKEKHLIEESEDKPLPQDIQDAENILDPEIFSSKETSKEAKSLEIGEPLDFDKKEKYSFAEWLQLTSKKKIDRESTTPKTEKSKPKTKRDNPSDNASLKKQKFDIIDKFIAENPKIVPKENIKPSFNPKDSVRIDKNELMTETLARVYLEQKKYKKAIQAYKILSLKYPEKSSFFADRIKSVQKIQQENK